MSTQNKYVLLHGEDDNQNPFIVIPIGNSSKYSNSSEKNCGDMVQFFGGRVGNTDDALAKEIKKESLNHIEMTQKSKNKPKFHYFYYEYNTNSKYYFSSDWTFVGKRCLADARVDLDKESRIQCFITLKKAEFSYCETKDDVIDLLIGKTLETAPGRIDAQQVDQFVNGDISTAFAKFILDIW